MGLGLGLGLIKTTFRDTQMPRKKEIFIATVFVLFFLTPSQPFRLSLYSINSMYMHLSTGGPLSRSRNSTGKVSYQSSKKGKKKERTNERKKERKKERRAIRGGREEEWGETKKNRKGGKKERQKQEERKKERKKGQKKEEEKNQLHQVTKKKKVFFFFFFFFQSVLLRLFCCRRQAPTRCLRAREGTRHNLNLLTCNSSTLLTLVDLLTLKPHVTFASQDTAGVAGNTSLIRFHR